MNVANCNDSEFFKLLDAHPDLLKQYLRENLLDKIDAKDITGQSQAGFNQSVNLMNIPVFFSVVRNERSYHRLFLKKELETYCKTKKVLTRTKS